jgi:hypothetical protein
MKKRFSLFDASPGVLAFCTQSKQKQNKKQEVVSGVIP